MKNNNISKKIVKKVTKAAKKNPNAAIAITATAGTGFMGLGVLNLVQYMRNRKLVKAAKAMDDSQNSNDTQQAPTNNIDLGMLQAAFNEFMRARQDPRSNGVSDDRLADVVAARFSSDPSTTAYIRGCIMNNVMYINMQNLQAAVMRTNNTTQTPEPNVSEIFDEPDGTANDETDDTNPDEGKYPASSKKQQKNGGKMNNGKKK